VNENTKKWMAAYPTMTEAEMWLMAYIWDSGGGVKTTEGFQHVVESYLNARDTVPADREPNCKYDFGTLQRRRW
jgi:hypothetical protein